jgi:hypothetical protein
VRIALPTLGLLSWLLLPGIVSATTPIPWDPPNWGMDIPFEMHASGVPADRRMLLLRVAQWPNSIPEHSRHGCPDFLWVATGHTDPKEKKELARARASAVAEWLVVLGAPKNRVCVDSKDSAQPLAPSPSPKNARVEVDAFCTTRERARCE